MMTHGGACSPGEDAWQELYRRTFFQVKGPDGKLVRFTALTADQYPFLKQKQFAIITAFNPMNRIVSERENLAQNVFLEKDLATRGFYFYATRGELDGHFEDSFTVENISQAQAVEIGVKYHQHSILYNDAQGVRFVRCCPA